MERVTGIGGIFFKVKDPKATVSWYQQHLGIEPEPYGGASFHWREHDAPEKAGQTVWSPFAEDSTYFNPSRSPFMVNYRVKDLHAMLAQLRAAGCAVNEKVNESEYGKFGWVMDPDGNRIELWEPPPGK